MDNLCISYPHMGNYHLPIKRLLETLFPDRRVLPAPAMTKRTIELGSRFSPDFVCSPFKYNLGNYIEALEQGANVLFQTGMGCRYGYYGELQEQILRDLGYDFTFVCLSRERASPRAAYGTLRRLGSPLSPAECAAALLSAAGRIRAMDRFEFYARENAGFEARPGAYESLRRRMMEEIAGELSPRDIFRLGEKYQKKLLETKTDKPEKPLRVGIVGELYTVMEPFSNFYIEDYLIKQGISVSRRMNVSFLLFGKHDKETLKNAGGYLRYTVGANGVDSVAQCKKYAELGYDGVIHVKSFGCTPELNATPSLLKLAQDYNLPVLRLSFDSHTSETGILTRLEAFCDMLRTRREKKAPQGPAVLTSPPGTAK